MTKDDDIILLEEMKPYRDRANKLVDKTEETRLNKLGAEIMGWEYLPSLGCYVTKSLKEATLNDTISPMKFSPATNLNHFMLVVTEMRKQGWEFIIFLYLPDKVFVDCWHPDRKISEERISVTAEDQTNLALAGMRCIEKAVEKRE